LFWVAPGAVALLVAQAVALAVGALAVFGIAARRLGDERPAAVFALLYLVNPSLHGINVRDFHAAALAVPLLLAAIYFAERDSPWLFTLAVVLALGTREDATIPVVGLGIWLALAQRRCLWGGVTAMLAVPLARRHSGIRGARAGASGPIASSGSRRCNDLESGLRLAHRERPRRPALLAAGRASPGLGGHGPGAAGRFGLGAGPVCRAP